MIYLNLDAAVEAITVRKNVICILTAEVKIGDKRRRSIVVCKASRQSASSIEGFR
jgi:hypothetical protein